MAALSPRSPSREDVGGMMTRLANGRTSGAVRSSGTQTVASPSSSMLWGPTNETDGAVKNAARLAVYAAVRTRVKKTETIRMIRVGPFGQGAESSSPPRVASTEW
eukprot:5596233-Prymnesium_polylepis.2